MADPIRIDGSRGEGGGQTLRGAVALSSMSGTPVRVEGIRRNRRVGGLRPQHLAAVRIMARVCRAGVRGLGEGSTEIEFEPGGAAGAGGGGSGGEEEEDVGTAGSIPLILQALVPAASASRKRIGVTIRGGTDVPWSPTADYVRFVLADALERFGIRCGVDVTKRGYYPRGGGEMRVCVEPCRKIMPVSLVRGTSRRADVACTYWRVDKDAVESECAGIAGRLEGAGWDVNVRIAEEEAQNGGAAVTVYGSDGGSVAGTDGLWDAKRGGFGGGMRDIAGEFMHGGVRPGVDRNLADMLVVPASMADGMTVFRTDCITGHLKTALYVASKITGCRYGIGKTGEDGFEVRISGGPATAQNP